MTQKDIVTLTLLYDFIFDNIMLLEKTSDGEFIRFVYKLNIKLFVVISMFIFSYKTGREKGIYKTKKSYNF